MCSAARCCSAGAQCTTTADRVCRAETRSRSAIRNHLSFAASVVWRHSGGSKFVSGGHRNCVVMSGSPTNWSWTRAGARQSHWLSATHNRYSLKQKKSHPGTLFYGKRGEIGLCKDRHFFWIVQVFLLFFCVLGAESGGNGGEMKEKWVHRSDFGRFLKERRLVKTRFLYESSRESIENMYYRMRVGGDEKNEECFSLGWLFAWLRHFDCFLVLFHGVLGTKSRKYCRFCEKS